MENPRRKANLNYYKKTKHINLVFTPEEIDLYEFIKSKKNTNGFIKELIKQAKGRS